MRLQHCWAFVKWLFRDTYQHASAWGVLIINLAVVAFVADVDTNWVILIAALGGFVVFLDLLHCSIRYQYRRYQMEQQQILKELERKS